MVGLLVQDLLLILGGGLLAAWVCRRLRLSVLVGYLVVGGLLGSGVLGWVRDEQQAMRHLAEIGAFLLLFSIGLELTLEELLRLGRAFLLGGSIQVLLVAVPTACLLAKLGLPWRAAIMLGAAASFSSTVLVFKSLAEWGQTATPMGRRMISILLFQDAALVPLLLVLPMLGQEDAAVTLADWGVLLLKSALLVVALLSLRRGAVDLAAAATGRACAVRNSWYCSCWSCWAGSPGAATCTACRRPWAPSGPACCSAAIG